MPIKLCGCETCVALLRVLSLLDDIATSDASMGGDDIDRLCEAREILSTELRNGNDTLLPYDENTNRYTQE